MSPLWCLKYALRSSVALLLVLTISALLIGASVFESPAWAADERPVAVRDRAVVEAGKRVKIDAVINDYDPDGTRVRLKRVLEPSQGTARVNRKGKIVYRPDDSAEGKDVIRYVIRDRNGRGKRARGRVVVRILPKSGPGGTGTNDPPVADAGADLNVTVGQSLTLDGTASYDPNGDPLSYSWSLVSWPTGSVTTLSDPTTARPMIVADIAGTFIAELVVYDSVVSSTFDRVAIAATADSTPPPTPGNFAALCADPGVMVCEGFEGDLSAASFNKAAGGDPNDPHKPRINSVPEGVYEGMGSLQLTVDGSNGSNTTGDVAYDYGPVTSGTFYVSMMIRFGDGLQTKIQNDWFDGAKSMKHFQIVSGPGSCTGNSINGVNKLGRGAWQLTYSCSGKGWDVRTPSGDFNTQPKGASDNREYSEGACTYRHLSHRSGYNSPTAPEKGRCKTLKDDHWHLHELEITIGGGTRWWIDGVLVTDLPHAEGAGSPQGPYDRIWFLGYMTGYNAGSDPGLWRVWYDNLIISRNCITSC